MGTEIEIVLNKEGHLILPVKAVPGSSRSRIVGAWDKWLRVAIAAPPEKGKANKELIHYLARLFKMAKSSLSILSGEHDTLKKVLIRDGNLVDIRRIIQDNLTELSKADCDKL